MTALPSKSGKANEFPDAARQLRNRRSGPPLPGCDCVQCFGYCMVNQDVKIRELMVARSEAYAVRRDIGIPGVTFSDDMPDVSRSFADIDDSDLYPEGLQ